MRVALIGAGGQLATDLAPLFPDLVPLTRADLDITQPDAVATVLDGIRPDVVLNTAAYNLVDKAESEPERAFAVNALGARNLARLCGAKDWTLVHFSTDYVFGGEVSLLRRGWLESSVPAPVNVYGASKLAGEHLVRMHCPRHFVIRTCGLYGQAATKAKGNFVKTMLRLARERPEVRVVADQICTPTFTRDVARITAALLPTAAYGLYHATNSGECSWYAVADEAIRLAGLATPVVPIETAEYPTPARRPAFSALECSRIEEATGLTLRSWQEALAEYVAGLGDERGPS